MSKRKRISRRRAAEHLDRAVDHVLAAFIGIGGTLSRQVPDESLEVAMSRDDEFQASKRSFLEALEPILVRDRSRGLDIESAATKMASAAANVGWRIGISSGSRSPGTRGEI